LELVNDKLWHLEIKFDKCISDVAAIIKGIAALKGALDELAEDLLEEGDSTAEDLSNVETQE